MIDLRLGDCLDIMRGLPDGCVDAVITDPPYLTTGQEFVIGSRGKVAPVKAKTFASERIFSYSLDWVDEVSRFNPKHWIVFCNSYMLGALCAKVEHYAKVGAIFVWHKRNAAPSTRNVPRFDCEFILWAKSSDAKNGRVKEFKSQILDVLMPQAGCMPSERILRTDCKKAAHPTQKPVAIVEPFIDRLTEIEWTILDPFAGTGTTGVACVKLNRSFIGIEINEQYYNIAQKRIAEAQQQMVLL